jgi:phospholipid/cholesterol/gamma-HCH transport system permease protein
MLFPRIKNPTLRVIIITLFYILYVARLGLTVERVGKLLLDLLAVIGGIVRLFFETLIALPRPPYRFRLLIEQAVIAGWNTIPLIAVVLGFLGMITVLEMQFQFIQIHINDMNIVPGVAGLMFFRVFGPTVVASMMAAKVGAGFTAEIGGMNSTDQVDALKMMGVSPVHYLVVPRFTACVAMQVALSILGVLATFIGGFLANLKYTTFQAYVGWMGGYVNWDSMVYLMLKSLGLCWVVPIVSCHYGLHAAGGAKGVGEATTKAVVTAILIIIILDFTISSIADTLVSAVLSF